MQIQNIDENLSMNISDTSGVSLQVSDVDTSLAMNIDTNDVINLNIVNEEGNIGMEVETSGSKIEGTTDHSKLKNLDYEHSGHTGFQPKGDYVEDKKYVHTDNNFTTAEKNKLESLNNYDDTLINQKVSSNTSEINTLKKSVESKAEKSEIPNVSNFITNTVDNLVNYYLKSEIYTKEEINELASTIQTVNIKVVDTLPTQGQTNIIYFVPKTASTNDIYDEWIYINNKWEHIGNTQIDLSDYATIEWVRKQEYMPIKDFQDYMPYFYYDKSQIDAKLNDYYNKKEIDTKLENLPSGGTELTGGDNTVIEDNAINVYTNTGYKVIDKDIQNQSIKDSGTTGTTKMVYVDGKEIIILYDGTNKIRRSENGIDFEIITLPCVCKHLVYNADAKRLYGTDCSKYFIYSNDYGSTWNTISQTKASSVTMMAIGYGSGFRSHHKSTKEIISWTFNENTGTLAQNTRIQSTIVPEFTAMVNNTQFVWCNSTGTFKYGAGSQEGNFVSLSSISVNLLKRVNNITFLGLKTNNKFYILESASMITQYKWIERTLPDTCTLNDIIFNPYDETYYLFTDNVTYYKTKDFINLEPVDKNDLRGIQGYFTLMGIQMTTTYHNRLLLAPTRTKLENKLQEHDRDLNKSLWVGKGLGLTEEGKVNVKTSDDSLGVSDYGIYIAQIDEYKLSEDIVEGVYVAKAKEKGLFDPYEVENWFYSEEAYPENNGYKAVKFVFTQDGSFYDQVTWETEFVVEKYEYGYLFYDAGFTVFKYVKLGNLSWLLNSIIQ